MQVRIWGGTDFVGSTIEDVIDLDDNLSDEEIEEEAYDAVMEHVEWGYERVMVNMETALLIRNLLPVMILTNQE